MALCYPPLLAPDLRRVIDGQGTASRIPVLLHPWISAQSFETDTARCFVQDLLDDYSCDAQIIYWKNIEIYQAPQDDPSYCWIKGEAPSQVASQALDAQAPLADWSQLDGFLADFPSPDYPHIFPLNPPPDGRYRLAHWWYTLFERHWSLRGMSNALMDYYTNPVEVHRLYRALTDFYKRMIVRAYEELGADGVYCTDDLGAQTRPFFSLKIFDTFFAPYYRELVETAHRLGMHFWLHTCGNVEQLLSSLIELGVDVLHPVQKYAMDERKIAVVYGGQIAFWVGFDVQQTIPFGTSEDVRREVRHLLDTFYRPDGRLLFTMGNGVTGDTPLASLQALFEEAFSYGTGIVSNHHVSIPS
jgi:uroporphyrinogen decarboxylase